MRFIQFLKWWWDKNDWFNRTIVVIVLQGILFCLSTVFIGKLGFGLACVGAIAICAAWGIFGVFAWFRGLWKEFEDKNPTEDVAIVRRLKGIPTPSAVEEPDNWIA